MKTGPHCLTAVAAFVVLAAGPARAQPAAENPLWQQAQAVLAGAVASASAGSCAKPQGLPRVRKAGQLVVESPPRAKPERWLRLRTHRSPPDRNGLSQWEGPEVPAFVPLSVGSLELELLDAIPGGYLSLYRSRSSALGANDDYEVRLFSCSGQTLAAVPLNPLMSRRDQLEVQDIRFADRVIYFNEACQSYSRNAGGRCSALLAVDPFSGRRLWRTGPLVSNSVIRVVGSHVVAGYGFTAERDWVRIVRRSDGRVVEQESMPSSHFGLEVRGSVLDVEVGGSWASYQMDGFATAAPQLQSLGTRPASAPPPAAATPAAAAAPWPAWTLPPQLPALPVLPALPGMAPAPQRATPVAPGALFAPWLPPGLLPGARR